MRIEDADGKSLFSYNYNEFIDNINIANAHTLVFRVRLDDRPKKADVLTGGTGGALGRWLFHCHIFHHAGLGMISELVVRSRPAAVPGLRAWALGALALLMAASYWQLRRRSAVR